MKNELYNFIIDKFDKGINEIDVVNGIIISKNTNMEYINE
jgi:hypothetical protein